MSLLMDALKRAETSKQEATRNLTGQPPSTDESLKLEPLVSEPPKSTTNPLPKLGAHIEAVDIELATTAQPVNRPPPQQAKAPATASRAASQEAVRNAFAAKQTSEPPSRLPLWLALGTLGFAGVAIGGYVWYQTTALNHGTLAASPVIASPAPVQQPQVPPPPVPAVPLSEAPDFGQKSELTAATPPQTAPAPLFPRPERRLARPSVGGAEAQGATPIRLVRTRPEPDTHLVRGFASLQRGEIDLSRREFEQVLQREPNNTDALLALAAIAHRQGRPADAENMRQRALVANPSDPAAQAANLNHAATDADPNTAESRLKTLLSGQPESPPLNFALGNLYSRQSRWSEAQQAYFNSVAAEGDNPDYLFNLAVSLDHLRQPRLAAQHYRLALEAAAKRPAAFDRDKLQKRLSELQAERQP